MIVRCPDCGFLFDTSSDWPLCPHPPADSLKWYERWGVTLLLFFVLVVCAALVLHKLGVP